MRGEEANRAYLASGRLLAELLPGIERMARAYYCGGLDGRPGYNLTIDAATGAWYDRNTGARGESLITLLSAQRGITQGEALRLMERRLDALAKGSAFARGARPWGRTDETPGAACSKCPYRPTARTAKAGQGAPGRRQTPKAKAKELAARKRTPHPIG